MQYAHVSCVAEESSIFGHNYKVFIFSIIEEI